MLLYSFPAFLIVLCFLFVGFVCGIPAGAAMERRRPGEPLTPDEGRSKIALGCGSASAPCSDDACCALRAFRDNGHDVSLRVLRTSGGERRAGLRNFDVRVRATKPRARA